MRLVTRLPVICGVVLSLPACMVPQVLPPLDSVPLILLKHTSKVWHFQCNIALPID